MANFSLLIGQRMCKLTQKPLEIFTSYFVIERCWIVQELAHFKRLISPSTSCYEFRINICKS